VAPAYRGMARGPAPVAASRQDADPAHGHSVAVPGIRSVARTSPPARRQCRAISQPSARPAGPLACGNGRGSRGSCPRRILDRARGECSYVAPAPRDLPWRLVHACGREAWPSPRRRALRGGSWNNNPRNVRAATRDRNNTGNRNTNTGFRVASTPPYQSRADHGPSGRVEGAFRGGHDEGGGISHAGGRRSSWPLWRQAPPVRNGTRVDPCAIRR